MKLETKEIIIATSIATADAVAYFTAHGDTDQAMWVANQSLAQREGISPATKRAILESLETRIWELA